MRRLSSLTGLSGTPVSTRQPTARRGSGVVSLAGGRIAAALLSWIWLVVAARHLTVRDFGDLALLLAIGAIVTVVGDLGLPLVLMKQASEDPSTAWTALALTVRKRLVAGVVATGVLMAAYTASTSRHLILLPAIFGISLVSTTIHSSVTAVLRAVGSARVEAANEVVSRVAVLVLGSYLLSRGAGLVAAVTTYALADLGSAVVLSVIAWRRLAHSANPVDRDEFAVRRNAPLALSGVLSVLYNRMDVWLLAVLAGGNSVAIYAASYRLLDGLLLPAGAVSALVIPRTASLDDSERDRVLSRFLRLLLLAVIPASVALAAFAGPVLARTFGPEYREGAAVLASLLLSSIPGVVVLLLAPLAALAQRRVFLRIVLASVALNGLANLVLIPAWGPVGAAWATVGSQCILAGLLWRVIHGDPGREPQTTSVRAAEPATC